MKGGYLSGSCAYVKAGFSDEVTRNSFAQPPTKDLEQRGKLRIAFESGFEDAETGCEFLKNIASGASFWLYQAHLKWPAG
jgi:hypothetical protein